MANHELDEITDGPDVLRAEKKLREARQDRRNTDAVVKEANQALLTLRQWHTDNHFADKLRTVLKGAPQ